MFELFSAFFPILTSFSLKPLTRNHSYIMVYYVFFNQSVTTTVPLGTFTLFDYSTITDFMDAYERALSCLMPIIPVVPLLRPLLKCIVKGIFIVELYDTISLEISKEQLVEGYFNRGWLFVLSR